MGMIAPQIQVEMINQVLPELITTVVKESENTTLGYKELELSNGVRVVLKKTDFKQDEISMSAFQRGGQSLYSEKDWANLQMLSALSGFTGVGNFSNSELQKGLANLSR